ncbi:DNA-directed RNA polymerase subunit alpha C-terminal domain-containing protein [Bradyrhizobium diazoefficiens]|uniref:RNA polymerase alpha subunit C-terminal domain-containing protein n=1 Tax=Bradyrhizobium diazoefficiens TaxID=1355477 RepID=A0A809WRA4_9BRAD|nr:hypothetical protein XF1B_04250 [Bradyrhizobium diazoefficiens]BCF22472.1 hypothetical protein XF14B_04240 [Bradyrhizobium diazoefficiens]
MKVPYWPPEELAATVLKTGALFECIDEMPLSVRSANCLKNADIDYVGQLVQKTDQELLRVPNFNRLSLEEVIEALTGLGLPLEMDLSVWPGPTKREPDAQVYAHAR